MGLRSPAIFLDRDDTLIHCDDVTPDGDLGDPSLVELLPGVLDGCRALKRAGFTLVVVSNQGGVARGRYGVAQVQEVNARLNELLGGLIDAFYFCPYHPQGVVPEFKREHPWRKPQPGMLLDASSALNLDLARSWSIGDRVRDCTAGKFAGCRTILLPTPPYRRVAEPEGAGEAFVDFRAESFADAVAVVLRESSR
ncbi:MAG: HAD family hydrolase [Phycisphaerae bacterium]|nr:HAD family hydrolase [Phycisphaerae bacterium]